MKIPHSMQIEDALNQLKSAEAELEELKQQLSTFEALVDAQLGDLLDQLSDLNAETAVKEDQLKRIREERLYGKDLMSYQEGAPQPIQMPRSRDLPTDGLSSRGAIHARPGQLTNAGQSIPDIKMLYRKLARRYHPDLARSEADRASSNERMAEINQAYNTGDLKSLMHLAGVGLPYGTELPIVELRNRKGEHLTELETAQHRLQAIRQQINQMSGLPIIKLSLEVKLAKHQGRNLLREMAYELQFKIRRKIAERDYLQAQVKAHLADNA